MTNTCQNCQKEYEAKRRSGKFCSTACRVSAWEKAQPLPKMEEEEVGHERYLAVKIEAYAQEADRLLIQMMDGDRGKEAIQKMVNLVRAMSHEKDNSIVREVLTPKPFTPFTPR